MLEIYNGVTHELITWLTSFSEVYNGYCFYYNQDAEIHITHVYNFMGSFKFLSNFYISPFEIDGVRYLSNEHWYQSNKTDDNYMRGLIINAESPALAKKLAKNVTRPINWPDISLDIMYRGLKAKFTQNSELHEKLLDLRGLTLIEGNTWHDNFWGACTCNRCVRYVHMNYLGLLLTKLIKKELSNVQ